MTDILDMPGWSVLSTYQSEGEYVIEAVFATQPETCPKCGVVDTPYKHGVKPIKYRDSPIRGLPVVILAQVQRYRCKHCEATFLQALSGIQPDMRMTQRCADYIETQCLRDTFIRVAEHIGCDDKTVRTIASGYIEKMSDKYKPWLPEWLGIDETEIDGKQRCVITDVVNRVPVDMLIDREKQTVVAWLYQFKDRRTVKGLAIDMWRQYRDAAQLVFPGLPVIIDKFHVVKMANKALELIRVDIAKAQQKGVGKDWMQRKSLLRMRRKSLSEKALFNLDMWMDNAPELNVAYQLKERFFEIYDASSKAEAAERIDAWAASVPAGLRRGKRGYGPALTSLKNWRTEILAFFDYPISNGYTEALNGVAKVVNRQGRGYSFEVLRARVLFGRKKPVMPMNAEPMTRCASCNGLFTLLEMASHIRPFGGVVSAENATVLCMTCHARFHTGGAKHGSSLSTP